EFDLTVAARKPGNCQIKSELLHIRHRGTNYLAAPKTLQSQVSHQSRNRTTGNVHLVTPELLPDLHDAVALHVVLPYTLDVLTQQLHVGSNRTERSAPRGRSTRPRNGHGTRQQRRLEFVAAPGCRPVGLRLGKICTGQAEDPVRFTQLTIL